MSIVTLTDGLPAILGSIRALESEHGPDDWPAVQMRDLTAMRDEIAHLRVALEHAWGELDDLKAQPQPEAQDEYPSVKQKRLLGEARAVLAAKGKP